MSHEAIDWAIKQDARGNAPRKLILILLANRADDAWVCWPSNRLIAEESGLSIRQVVRHIASLEQDGLIRRVPWERADGGQGANVFALGPTATDAPVSCTTRGGGHVRHGGWVTDDTPRVSYTTPLEPKEETTKNPHSSGPREESRGRSLADANETHTPHQPTERELWQAIRATALHNPDTYQRQIDTIRARAPRLWRDATDAAFTQFRENDSPHQHDPAQVALLAYQYVIQMRAPDWPAWLLGPLLPMLATTQTDTTRAA